MLERLAQLVVDKLEPKIERIVQTYLDELRLEIRKDIDEALNGIKDSVNIYADGLMPDIEKRLKREITQQIVRGIKS